MRFQIRDGINSASLLLEELNGTNVPQYIVSSTPAMLLIFSSDDASVLDGYNVTWRAKPSNDLFDRIRIDMYNAPVIILPTQGGAAG